MKSTHFEKHISAYLDGELKKSKSDKVEKHLAECSLCRELYKDFKETRKATLKREQFQVSPYFANRVIANYQSRNKETFWNSFDFLPRPVINGILVVSVILLVMLSLPQHHNIQTIENFMETSDYSIIFENGTSEILATNDQALQFVLYDDGTEVFEGEP